jgi:hypothetical protein
MFQDSIGSAFVVPQFCQNSGRIVSRYGNIHQRSVEFFSLKQGPADWHIKCTYNQTIITKKYGTSAEISDKTANPAACCGAPGGIQAAGRFVFQSGQGSSEVRMKCTLF